MNARRPLRAMLAAALALLAAAGAAAQEGYPSRPIRLVVGAAPGGPTDIVARLLGERMARNMNATIVVENRGGGGGVIASETVARAEPDGYTLLMGTVSTHGINPTLYKKLNYDALKDFTPISEVVSYPLVLVVNPAKVPAKTVAEFVEHVRRHPQQVQRGSAGNGTSMHLAGDLFNSTAKTEMNHVPYRGSAPAVTALLAGQIDAAFESIPVVLPHIQAGKLRALGLTGPQRSEVLPGVPAIAETLPGYEFTGWLGLVAPTGTPAPVVERLHREIVKALADPELRKKLLDQAVQPVGSSPAEFGAYIRSEIAKLGAVVRASGATVD